MRLKTWHVLGYLFGLIVALEPSYIHPDEHFQSLEVMMIKIMGIKGTIPWEFKPESAARSFVPLYITYGPLLYLNKYILHLSSGVALMYLVRIQNYIVFMYLSKLALQFLLDSKLDRKKASFYISTSYIIWAYQTHSFSNSLESIILLLVLSLFRILIKDSSDRSFNHYKTCVVLGILVTLGVFNRITFLAFILLPCVPTFHLFYSKHLKSLCVSAISFICSCLLFVFLDKTIYGSDDWCVTPLNNLLYNLQDANLAQHGLHPRYTHVLVNVPQMLGPIMVFFVSKKQKINLALLSCISGLLILSLFRHQELRFLVPLFPLFCISIDLEKLNTFPYPKLIAKTWVAFNIVFGIIMGSLHQRGVVTAIQRLAEKQEHVDVHLWWKTYSPPTWLYMNNNLTVSTTNFVNSAERLDNVDFGITVDHVVDLKGCDYELFEFGLMSFLNSTSHGICLIIPKSTDKGVQKFRTKHEDVRFQVLWETPFSLDLDHIDFTDLSTLQPGMTIYQIDRL
ncbi:glycosylphosphatidylinositol-alpha 1,2 mannosyltransferase [Lachancea thermotolerans CBS 6340]|uniref:Mannosyltransferase n=1 Tax=Lachancea thermotolerans (strain ATCC 56472 / CBS 6340 / NRRL Y-8284) TaxID=559295 RepID=C5DLQ7_LACTC|nr:KLTH0G02684p [Lachancea thermotolerans CBS 6340]CAR24718.1 KLTH0G02684p [Lachancea thermotolerans CBS 6340]